MSPVQKSNLIQKLFIRNADIELPEQRLWMAVLCHAIADLLPGERKHPVDKTYVRNSRRAAKIFFERGQYVIFCDWVGLDPDWVLEILRDHAGLSDK